MKIKTFTKFNDEWVDQNRTIINCEIKIKQANIS
jgi:hypothetical protein